MDTQKIAFSFVSPDGDRQDVTASPGETVMQVAYQHGIEGIAAECGGSMSCGTCHVVLDAAAFERLDAPTEGEIEMLDLVSSARQPTSRLSCQVKVSEGLAGASVQIPESQF